MIGKLQHKLRVFLPFLVCIALSIEANAQRNSYVLNPLLPKAQKEAILILPGFGSKVFGTKKIRNFFKKQGYDLYVPNYISRKSVAKSVTNLDEFIQQKELLKYQKLHVFAYIFGSWTINQWIAQHGRHNIQTLVYDRSPLQERIPAILVSESPILAKILFGPVMNDFCKTSYFPVQDSSIYKGIFIETYATKLVKKHQKSVMNSGLLRWDVASLNQTNLDFCYIPLNHDEMYWDLPVFGSEVIHFIQFHSFSATAKNNSIPTDPFIKFQKK
jgi:hypothetical protein